MAENATLEEKELETLQKLSDSINKLKFALGEMEVKKLDLFGQVSSLHQQFAQMESSLIEKYGKDSVINLKTGEVKKK
jgi:hypothetical protein